MTNGHDPRGQRLTTDPIMFNRVRRLMDGVVANLREGPRNNGVQNNYLSRREWLTYGDNLDERRSIFDECGYPPTMRMTPQRWQLLYERDAIACRIVEVMSKEAWQVSPNLCDGPPGSKYKDSEWNRKWAVLGNNLGSGGWEDFFAEEEGGPINEALMRINIMSGIGRFGALYFGLDDGNSVDKPVAGLEELGSEPREVKRDKANQPVGGKDGKPVLNQSRAERNGKKGHQRWSLVRNAVETEGRKLAYLRVFPEHLAYPSRFEGNKNSPRFGMPVTYQLRFNDPQGPMHGAGLPLSTEHVHWTRVQHVADTAHTAGSSDVWAVPRCQPVLNNVMAAQKVYGGSGEGYWKAVFSYLFLETHPQLGGDVDVDDESLRDMMEEMMNGLQRFGLTSGMSAKTVSPSLSDPTPHLNAQLEAICIKLGMPMRIFKGSERGELASSQDDSAWNDRVKAYQSGYVTPGIVRPFCNRLVTCGVMPRPQKGLRVEWPDITSMGAQEKAQVAQTRMSALSQYLNGGGGQAMTLMDFYVKEFGYSEEEALVIINNVMGEGEDAYKDEPGQEEYVAPESVEGEGEDAPAAEGEPGAEPPDEEGKPGAGKMRAVGNVANEKMCWGHPCAEPQAEAMERTGHEAHQVHVGEELIHGHFGPTVAAATGHFAGRALRQMSKVPGLKTVAGKLADAHDHLTAKAEGAIAKLKERYGDATTSAIIGASIAAIPGGSVALAVPGGKLVASLPGLALAEVGHRLGLVGPDTKLEAGMGKVAAVVHGVRRAIGRAGAAVGRGLESAGKAVLDPAIKNRSEVMNADEPQLSPEEHQRLAQELLKELTTGLDLSGLEGVDALAEGDDDDGPEPEAELTQNAHMCWGHECNVGDTVTYTGRGAEGGAEPAEFRGFHSHAETGEKMARVIFRPKAGAPFETSVSHKDIKAAGPAEEEPATELAEPKWGGSGFGSDHAQQLSAYSNKLNRKPYTPLSPDEVKGLQAAGHLTSHKVPKITPKGRVEMDSARRAEQDDIKAEVERYKK